MDGVWQSFSLDKWSGKKCIMLGARDLKIIWTDTPDYWTWISHPESRFNSQIPFVSFPSASNIYFVLITWV